MASFDGEAKIDHQKTNELLAVGFLSGGSSTDNILLIKGHQLWSNDVMGELGGKKSALQTTEKWCFGQVSDFDV